MKISIDHFFSPSRLDLDLDLHLHKVLVLVPVPRALPNPARDVWKGRVEIRGFEPLTYALQRHHSTN